MRTCSTGTRRSARNTATAEIGGASLGGAIFARDDLSIANTQVGENTAAIEGRGGAISMVSTAEGSTLKLTGVTLNENSAQGRGGAIDFGGLAGQLVAKRIAVVENDARSFGGGLFTGADSTITESVFDSNSVAAATAASSAQGGGIFSHSEDAADAQTMRVSRTSITNNEVTGGDNQEGAGIYTTGVDLRLENSTLSANQALLAGADGGGLLVDQNDTPAGGGQPTGSAKIYFSTFRENFAGIGVNDGDAIFASLADSAITVRASIIDESSDGCVADGLTDFQSGGYNVEDVIDPDCGLDAPTDSHEPDFLNPLGPNGSPTVGMPASPPFVPGTVPLTNAFTNDESAALDNVPANKCKIDGKQVKIDARGVPRPAAADCDAGAVEFTGCNQTFVAGPNSYVGRKSADSIQGSSGEDDVVLAQGGDDFITTYGGIDAICAGSGDDVIMPQAGSDDIDGGSGQDLISYNNAMPGGITVDMEAGTASGPTIGSDFFGLIEGIQGSEDDDTLSGSDGDDLLIGGGDPDEIDGRGGIDKIDAKDGEADVAIDCGPGKNSKEKAKIDQGLDPDPVSC